MKHEELVLLGTDLLAGTRQPEQWLAEYDRALESPSDERLAELVSHLATELHDVPVAA